MPTKSRNDWDEPAGVEAGRSSHVLSRLQDLFTHRTRRWGCTVCERVWSEVQVLSRYAYSGLELKATALP